MLLKMALDLLSIPLMSAECERVFSSVKNLITSPRNGLKEDIIEACTLLRHSYKEEGLLSLPSQPEVVCLLCAGIWTGAIKIGLG